MNTREYGFEPIEGVEQRALEFLASLTPGQRKAFRALSEVQETYYQDAKQFMAGVLEDELANKTVSVAQRKLNITLASTNLMLRAMTKFMLATGEILTVGEAAPIAPETDRVIKLG